MNLAQGHSLGSGLEPVFDHGQSDFRARILTTTLVKG